MRDYVEAANDDPVLEDEAGWVLKVLMKFAIRSAESRLGKADAMDALAQIEAGRARMRAELDVGDGTSLIRCWVVPLDERRPRIPIVAFDLQGTKISH